MKRQHLTLLEIEILKALANGMQSKEIAQAIERSTATVELYIRYLYVRLDARSRAQLVAHAFCEGAIGPNDLAIEAGNPVR